MTDLSRWPALVLTAGLATRLRPLSRLRAKAALPVAGEPLIGRVLAWLRRAGVTRVVLNLHHRAESITALVGEGSRWGLSVRYSWEREVLGSAGGPARAIPLLASDRFLIVNGDTLADIDLAGLASQHVATGAQVTMAVVEGDARYNSVLASDDAVVRGFSRRESPAPAPLHPAPLHPYHFIGIQAASASAFAGVSPDRASETVKALYPALIARRPDAVRVFTTAAPFFDIGTPRDYLDTALSLADREGRALDRGRNVTVAPGATLTRTLVWDNVVIGAHAALTDCIVTDNVTVAAGASFSQCALLMVNGAVHAEPL